MNQSSMVEVKQDRNKPKQYSLWCDQPIHWYSEMSCKHHVATDTVFEQTECTIFLHVISMD